MNIDYILNLPLFIINLKSRPDRFSSSHSALTKFGFKNINRIDAVVGKELDLDTIDISLYTRYLLENKNKRCSHYQLHTLGAIGCSLSHYKCWEIITQNKFEECLIFEDDCDFNKDFLINLSKEYLIYKNLNCDILIFGYNYSFDSKLIEDKYKQANNFFGTHGYLVNKQGVSKLKKYFFPLENHLDAYFSLLIYHKYINGILSKNSILYTDDYGSDIGHGDCHLCVMNDIYNKNYPDNSKVPILFIKKLIITIISIIFVIYLLRKLI